MKAGHTSKRTSLLIRISTHDVLSGSSVVPLPGVAFQIFS